MFVFSVYAGKTSTPRSAARIPGRRNVNSTAQIITPARHRTAPPSDVTPLSPVNPPAGPALQPEQTHDSLQRTSSWQSSASAGSSKSGGSRTGPVPKPRSSITAQTPADEVDQAPSKRPGRDPRRRDPPGGQIEKPGVRSQSSPADRVKTTHQVAAPHAKSTTPGRGAGIQGRSVTPRTHQHVDRSLGSTESPLSAFTDTRGHVFDVRSKTAYKRGRLLGKVPYVSVFCFCTTGLRVKWGA